MHRVEDILLLDADGNVQYADDDTTPLFEEVVEISKASESSKHIYRQMLHLMILKLFIFWLIVMEKLLVELLE